VLLSVNLSAQQLIGTTLHDSLRAILSETGLEPGRLCLEITESVLSTTSRPPSRRWTVA